MRNYVQPGRTITLPAPYGAVNGGDGLLVGSLFGVAGFAAAQNDPVEADVEGVFDLAKADSQAWTVGAKVYWDNTARVCTTVSTNNTLVGVAVLAVGAAAGLIVGRVRLNGSVA